MRVDNPTVSGGNEATPEPQRLGGRYELGAVLGHGGMAVVRRGTDLRLGRTVAVKMLDGGLAEAPAFRTRFRREARAAAALDHPGIVSVYDAGEDVVDDVAALYFVMEYVDGRTLRDLLLSGPQEPRRALEVTAEVLDALAHSHQAGLVHRDIKPGNVMVTPTGEVKVMDFGVARAVADASASLTQTAAVIGTAQYLSPEQARGDEVDARSDVYAAGCLLYELLTGRPPFVGDSAIAVAYQHVREVPQPPSAFAAGLPRGIDAIVLGALAKQPDERYQSATDMRRDILAVLAGRPAAGAPALVETTAEIAPIPGAAIVASPSAPAQSAAAALPTQRRRRRRNIALLAAAAAIVAAAAVGGFALKGLGDAPAPRRDAEPGVVGGRQPNSTPQPEAKSGPVAPAGVSDPLTGDRGQDTRPRRGSDNGAGPAQPVDDAAPTPPGLRADDSRPEPTQAPEPAAEPTPTPVAEESPPESTAPEESPPAESPEPEPTPTPTSQAPTTPPPAEEPGP
jgi:eukaryotic-like serine/threonine-protein kinase